MYLTIFPAVREQSHASTGTRYHIPPGIEEITSRSYFISEPNEHCYKEVRHRCVKSALKSIFSIIAL